jgi:hypothetical protein
MWIAIRENATYTATVRKDGKFTGNYCHELLSAVFEWSWLEIRAGLIRQCNNRAAVALLDNEYNTARVWMARTEKVKEIG